MFVFYAFLLAVALSLLNILYFKIFQLENYKIKKYIKNIVKCLFAFGDKSFLVFTKRILRLILIGFLLNFTYFLLFFGLISNFWINLLISIALFLLSPFLVIITFLFAMPIEEQIKRFYLKKAKKKLKKSKCKKIAITGSFGKTSTKNILYALLAEEFDVCATPKSYNTPMGICKSILENLKETDDFFIVEMGARRKGDIEFLAKYVGVDFAIITPIGNCHLETFGTLENIENTKYELCENAKDVVIFNGKSKSTKKLFARYPRKKFLVCTKNSFAYAKNIKTSSNGSEFVMVIDQKEFVCKTKLLGKSNIDNIVVASAMAYLLGESLFSISKAISSLKPVPHRLELIKGDFADVVDDSYNSNFDGFMQALQILKAFKGKKVVVSPGIVELGTKQEEINIEVARQTAKVADVFVIMNQTNKLALLAGAKDGGMKDTQIYFANTRTEQKDILKKVLQKGDVVLFENDLPDNFK
ncbi:MAG: Mur ligase family protein [Candidatus Caccovivens sp.]